MLFGACATCRNGVRALSAGVACLAVVLAVGCGDDSSSQGGADQNAEAKAIIELGRQLDAAYQQGDAAAACELVSPASRKDEIGGMKACVKQVNNVINQGTNRPETDFNEITVDGDSASAVMKSKQGGETKYKFVKVDGKWYIDVSGS